MSRPPAGPLTQELEHALCTLENLIWQARYYRKDLNKLVRREQALSVLRRASLAGENERVAAAASNLLTSGVLFNNDILIIQSQARL